jgi:hypothetical protein
MESIWQDWDDKLNSLHDVSMEFINTAEIIDPDVAEKAGKFKKWSPKDVVSHIMGWEFEVIDVFRKYLSGDREVPDYDIDSFNAQSVDSRRDKTWYSVIDELKAAQSELKKVNASVTQKDLETGDIFIEWVDILIDHYVYHTNQLKSIK